VNACLKTRRSLLVLLALGAFALFLSQIVEIPVRSALRGYDNTFNYLWLRSAMVDGDWDFRNDIEQCNTLTPEYRQAALSLPKTEVGRLPNKYGIGWALVTLPFYGVADALVTLGILLGFSSLRHDGFNAVYQVVFQLGHAGLAVASIMAAARVVASWLKIDRWEATVGVGLVWFASPLLYYQTVNLSMSHGVAFFAVALMAYGLERAREGQAGGYLNWMLVGLTWGLAVVTRYQLGIVGLPVLIVWVGTVRRSLRSGLFAAAAFLGGALPLVALQIWAWFVVYGRCLVFSYGVEGEKFQWLRPEVTNLLFSSFHGLFYWHPLLLVACIGLGIYAWQQNTGRVWGWVGAVVIMGYVNASWWCWWFASSFGSRAFDAAILPMMAGFAFLLARAKPRWHRLLVCVAVGAGAWNFYLAWLYRLALIPRNAPVTWSQMLAVFPRLYDGLKLF